MNNVNMLYPTIALGNDHPLTLAQIEHNNESRITLMHDFVHDLDYVEDFALRLKQFKVIPEIQHFREVHHLALAPEGWIHSVYNPQHGLLIVNNFSPRLMMPESSWYVEGTKITREIVTSERHVQKKVWELYHNNTFQEVWEVTYNEHPRDPLHMRKANVPSSLQNLVRELAAQIGSNQKLTELELNSFVNALRQWAISEDRSHKRVFTREECDLIWDRLSIMQHAHHLQWDSLLPLVDMLQALSRKQPSFKDFLGTA